MRLEVSDKYFWKGYVNDDYEGETSVEYFQTEEEAALYCNKLLEELADDLGEHLENKTPFPNEYDYSIGAYEVVLTRKQFSVFK